MQSDDSQDSPNWEDIRYLFEAAGAPLSPEQETQWQQANELLKTKLEEEYRIAPIWLYLRLFLLVILPRIALEIVGGVLLGDAIVDYVRTINQILTPEQRQIWEQTISRNQQHPFWRQEQ